MDDRYFDAGTEVTAGYSGTPLAKKLGIKSSFTIFVDGAPANYNSLVAPLPEDVTSSRS